jgi:hypothetical protein
MIQKAIFGLIGVALMTLFLGAVVMKLREPALAIVVLLGLILMIIDTVQSLRERD